MTAVKNDIISNEITKYCQLDDLIKQKKQELKIIKKEFDELQSHILSNLLDTKIDYVNAGDYGNIVVKTKESKSSINKDLIKEGFMETCNNNIELLKDTNMHVLVAEKCTECILQKRDVKVTQCLKRTKKKTKKNQPKESKS